MATPKMATPTYLLSLVDALKAMDPEQQKIVEQAIKDGSFSMANLQTVDGKIVYQTASDTPGWDSAQAGQPMPPGYGQPPAATTGASGDVISYKLPDGTVVKGIDTNGDGIPDVGPDGTGLPKVVQGGTKKDQANTAATLTSFLLSAGLNPNDKTLADLVDKGAKGGWNTDQFTLALYKTSEFQQAFPGFFKPNGVPKMSIDQYLETKQLYQQYGTQYGINVGEKRLAMLFRNNVSPTEAQQKFQADQQLRDNPALFKAYNEELKAKGLEPLDHGGILKVLLGQGNREYTQVWNEANVRYQGEQAGISFGRVAQAYTNLGQGTVAKIAGLGLTPDAQHQLFQQTAQELLTTLPLSRIQSYGLSKKDIVQAEFGGPHQAKVLQLMQHIKDQEKAFYEDRASASVFAKQGGGVETLGSSAERAQA